MLDSVAELGDAEKWVAEALARRAHLRPGESIITRDGVWVGRSWLRVSRDRDEHAGVISREKDLRALRDALQAPTFQPMVRPGR